MKKPSLVAIVAIVAAGLGASWSPAQAQLGQIRKIKERVKKEATKATEAQPDSSKQEAGKPAESSAAAPEAPAAKGGTATSEDMTLYT